jgi:ribosomal protein S4E
MGTYWFMVVLFDQYNLPEDIFEVIFATTQQVEVAKLLIEEMKVKGGEIGKTEMSMFATALHDGTTIETTTPGPFRQKKTVKVSYNKRQFYDRILTPMKTMGLIDYDLYKKTYKISEKFNKNMMRIGLMWLQELRRPPISR